MSLVVSAQDTIVKQNKEFEIGKVIEVRTDEVVYKKFDRPDGPNYTLPKSQIVSIHYADGHSDSFAQKVEASGESGRSLSETKDYIVRVINEFGSGYGLFARKLEARFEGEFLRLIPLNDKHTGPAGDGDLYDFTIIEKFYRISYRDNNVGVLDIKVAKVIDKKDTRPPSNSNRPKPRDDKKKPFFGED